MCLTAWARGDLHTEAGKHTERGKPPRVKGIHRNIWCSILGGRNISLQRILNLPQLVNRCLTLTSASPPITGMWPRGPDYHLPTSGKTQNFFTPSQFVYKLLSRKFFVSDFATAVAAVLKTPFVGPGYGYQSRIKGRTRFRGRGTDASSP